MIHCTAEFADSPHGETVFGANRWTLDSVVCRVMLDGSFGVDRGEVVMEVNECWPFRPLERKIVSENQK